MKSNKVKMQEINPRVKKALNEELYKYELQAIWGKEEGNKLWRNWKTAKNAKAVEEGRYIPDGRVSVRKPKTVEEEFGINESFCLNDYEREPFADIKEWLKEPNRSAKDVAEDTRVLRIYLEKYGTPRDKKVTYEKLHRLLGLAGVLFDELYKENKEKESEEITQLMIKLREAEMWFHQFRKRKKLV